MMSLVSLAHHNSFHWIFSHICKYFIYLQKRSVCNGIADKMQVQEGEIRCVLQKSPKDEEKKSYIYVNLRECNWFSAGLLDNLFSIYWWICREKKIPENICEASTQTGKNWQTKQLPHSSLILAVHPHTQIMFLTSPQAWDCRERWCLIPGGDKQ